MPAARELMERITGEMAKAIVGQEEILQNIVVAVLTGGPGVLQSGKHNTGRFGFAYI